MNKDIDYNIPIEKHWWDLMSMAARYELELILEKEHLPTENILIIEIKKNSKVIYRSTGEEKSYETFIRTLNFINSFLQIE